MKILVADDHSIFRKGLSDVIANAFPSSSVIESVDGTDTLLKIAGEKPDIVILDIDMPGVNGLEVCKTVTGNYPGIKVIMLTLHKEKSICDKAMLAGAKGYVVKDTSVNEILNSIDAVLKGKTFVSSSIYAHGNVAGEAEQKNALLAELTELLTETEIKVLKLVAEKYSSKEIAGKLFVSTKTIENYRSKICKKLDLSPRTNSLFLWTMDHVESLKLL